ncbi:YafY family transcriptional regulator [Natronospirillum operosum]|uniref:YafY family transcriptional regulator n=1 Tax=Natronospirillum operosum TaxID=2759953 RepID=A0A4Z0W4Y4_9GAMM|nr:YafY family protein [Natronospirillum operosum]TGG91751.1 YafY family transcriptional regulator [Natronospirillum operosum]
MNRFDRVTSLLLLLQTRSVVTARFLSEHFAVSERTIYRDIRTLENAGVPIGAEAGVGYFLEKSYRLPPVSFTLDETAALLLGERLLVSGLDAHSLQDFRQALNKVRAVIDRSDKDYLSSLDADIEVFPTGSHFPLDELNQHDQTEPSTGSEGVPSGSDRWLRDCRSALVRRQVVEIDYLALSSQQQTTRQIEPIGLFYYSWHWHLIAWCRLREGYRDFRLDRILSFAPQPEQFARHSRLTLQQYLNEQPGREELLETEVLFSPRAARFVEEQRYLFGFVDEERQQDGVRMRFLTPVPEYMARWLLQYIDEVDIIHGDAIRAALQSYSARLSAHWGGKTS